MKDIRRSAVVVLLLVCGTGAWAAPQVTFRHKTFEDFQNGETEGVAVIGVGALELGPRFEPFESLKPEAFVWALAVDSKGRVYAGTGNDGKVFVLDGRAARVVLTSDDLAVLSVAVDARDNAYAGSAPSGRIYRIPPEGEPALFCETGETYVWALALGPDGSLYAGTGPNGKLLRVSPDGKKVEVVYDSNDKHILCLGVAGGAVYAGTDENGLVYRVAADGRVSVACDITAREIRCMATDAAGNVYFGTADGIQPAPGAIPQREGAPAAPTPPPARDDGSSADARSTEPARNEQTAKRPPAYVPPKRPGAAAVSGANAVYRLSPDGRTTVLFYMAGVAFLSMAWHDGALYAGTAGEGKVFRIASERDVAVLAQADQPQVLSVRATQNGRLVVGTGNDGRVYVAGSVRGTTGTYTSAVIDARFRSTWGAATVEADVPEGAAVEFATRSGNSEKPDPTWSDWTERRSAGGSIPISSPPARFLQYRLTLTGRAGAPSPRVREVRFPCVADNYPPSIDSITLGAPPPPATGDPKKAPPAAKPASNGCVSRSVGVSWKASDPNGDALEYELFFRGADEKNWKLLADKLTAMTYTWDTDAVPDGVYRLKVRASDEPQNPAPRALADELVSDPVRVDNTPPAVVVVRTQVRDRVCTVEAEAKDAGSELTGARYSIDAGPWQPLLPVDGIFDAALEKLAFSTSALEPGEHTLVIRAEDSAGNIGSAKTVFEVPK